MSTPGQNPGVYRDGQRVRAYGKYSGVIVGDRLTFDAYVVKTEPLPVPGKKRRQRLTMVVHVSGLETALREGETP